MISVQTNLPFLSLAMTNPTPPTLSDQFDSEAFLRALHRLADAWGATLVTDPEGPSHDHDAH